MFLSRNILSAEQGLGSSIHRLPILLDRTGFGPETPRILGELKHAKILGKHSQCHNLIGLILFCL